jgi:hypothetical protein
VALLGDSFWGDCAKAVDGAVQQYLVAQMQRRRSAVPAAAAASVRVSNGRLDGHSGRRLDIVGVLAGGDRHLQVT